MKLNRSMITGLQKEHWFKPAPEKFPDLEFCIIPSAASSALSTRDMTPELRARLVCREAFVNFRGYENGEGQPAANTMEHRLELYSIWPLQVATDSELMVKNAAVLEGEGSAASD